MSTPDPLVEPRPLIVMDEVRLKDIYGDAFARLGLKPVAGHRMTPEQIVAARPAALFVSREWTPEWRLAAAAARRADIPVIYVFDGVVEWSYVWNNLSAIRPGGTMLQPMIASDLCVIGRHQARIFAGLGLAHRTHVVGLPRFDALSTERKIRRDAPPRLLVATPRTTGHNAEQQVLAVRALRDLRDWFATRPDIEIVWRISADLAEELGVPGDIEGRLDDVLATCSGLLSFTSTCLLEGMHKGIPTAQIDYRAAPLYVSTAWEIRCREHIPSVVQELLYPPPEKLAWQDSCYSEELEEGDATARLVEVIQEATSRAKPYAPDEAAEPTRQRTFGRLDYRQVHSELSAFALNDTSVLQYELSAALGSLRTAKAEKERIQRECVYLTEAFASSEISSLRVFPFVERIAEAQIELRTPGIAEASRCTMHGRTAPAIYLHPPATLRFTLPTGRAGRLAFAVGMHPDVWKDRRSGACEFQLRIDQQIMFTTQLDPVSRIEDRNWKWAELMLTAVDAPSRVVELRTKGIGNDMFRWAFWRNPVFLWLDPKGAPGFRPRAAEGYDFYIPGFTVPI